MGSGARHLEIRRIGESGSGPLPMTRLISSVLRRPCEQAMQSIQNLWNSGTRPDIAIVLASDAGKQGLTREQIVWCIFWHLAGAKTAFVLAMSEPA